MKKSKLFRIISLVLAVAALMTLCACNSQTESPTTEAIAAAPSDASTPADSSADAESTRTRGGTVINYINTNPTAFFTPYMSGTMNSYAWPCYEPLAWDKSDGTFEPCLAKSWELDSENNTLTITLNEGVYFSNGDACNAEDVVFTLTCREEHGTSGIIGNPKVEALDDLTVKVTWDAFSLNFEAWILPQYIYSKETYEEKGLDWMLSNMVGTGPYVMEEYIPDVCLRFTRNENYWREETPAPDSFEWVVITDKTAALAAFMNGEIDTYHTSDRATIEQLAAADFASTPSVTDEVCYMALPISTDPEDPLYSADVRRAVYAGIDWENMGKTVMGPSAYHTDTIGFPSMPYYQESIEKTQYDLEKAKQMLADAGYPNGFDTTIYAAPMNAGDATYIQAELKKLGINAEVETVDITVISSDYLTGKAAKNGIVLTLCKFYMTNQIDRFNKFLSPIGAYAGATNFPEEMVALWEKASNAKTQEEENQYLYDFVDAYIHEYNLIWPTYNAQTQIYMQSWYHRGEYAVCSSAGQNPFEIWVDAH